MKAVDKHQFLKELEGKVERHLQYAIRDFQNLQDEILLRPSPSGGWSIAQCLDHLNRYGHYYLPQIEKALGAGNSKGTDETFRSSWLGSYFAKMMDPQTGKRKFKAFNEYIPPPDLDPHTVVAEFIEQQEHLLSLLRKSHEANLNTLRIPISISKWIRLKLGDVFQFVIAHNERHVEQAKNALYRISIKVV